MVGHNGKLFDLPNILREMENAKLLKYCRELIVGFCDSLPIMKTLFPGKGSYKLGSLLNKISKETFNGHNAIVDANALARLFGKAEVTNDVLSAYSLTVDTLPGLGPCLLNNEIIQGTANLRSARHF